MAQPVRLRLAQRQADRIGGNVQIELSRKTAGIAGEAVKKLTTLLDKNGFLETQSTTLETRIKDYKAELLKLEARMTQLKERYNKQFSSMENIVGQSKSLKTSLTSTFDGMMSVYTNK